MMAGRQSTAGRNVTRAQHSFAKVPPVGGQRSVFNRSFNLKTAFNSGWIVPIFVDEALPGDTMNLKMSSFCRLATPIFPLMDNLYMDFFFFAVPNRLLWENWERFCGEQDDPGDSTDFLVPQVTFTARAGIVADIWDYMGWPSSGAISPVGDVTGNSLHLRAYNKIFNEWFRDQNLQNSLVVPIDDGPDTSGDYVLQRRGKRHDYFTSCLPFPQKGDPVDLPLGGFADVVTSLGIDGGTGVPSWLVGVNQTSHELENVAASSNTNWEGANPGGGVQSAGWDVPELKVDFSTTTAATVNALRQAFQVQRIFERDARAGTRYTEIIKSHFQVSSSDARLQRSEYLGGGHSRINITPVQATNTNTNNELFLGDLAGYGTQSATGIGFTKSFTEHCVLLGFVNVRAEISYQEGLERMWSRQTRFDFYWPTLAHLGEQEVLNKELVWTDSASDDLVFGYQERWAEYRYKPSLTTGIMRSRAQNSLDAWHLALDFDGSLPTLNSTFIQDNPPISRVIAVPSEPEFIGDFYFKYRCARPMPTYSVPGMIDHF